GMSYFLFAMGPVDGFLFRPNLATYGPPLEWNILGFATKSTGVLAPASATSGSAQVVPNSIAVDAEGRFVFTVNRSGSANYIQAYDIGFKGDLTPIAAPVGVSGTGSLATDPTGRFLYQLQ